MIWGRQDEYSRTKVQIVSIIREARHQGVPIISGKDPVLYLSNLEAITTERQRAMLDERGVRFIRLYPSPWDRHAVLPEGLKAATIG